MLKETYSEVAWSTESNQAADFVEMSIELKTNVLPQIQQNPAKYFLFGVLVIQKPV